MILKKQAGLLPCLFRDFLSRRLSQNGDLAADYHTDNIDNPENCGSDENSYDTHNYFQYASACHARANTINAVNYAVEHRKSENKSEYPRELVDCCAITAFRLCHNCYLRKIASTVPSAACFIIIIILL